MVNTIERVKAIVSSPTAEPQDVARALRELGRMVDPEVTAPAPQTALVFARALELVGSLSGEPDELALA